MILSTLGNIRPIATRGWFHGHGVGSIIYEVVEVGLRVGSIIYETVEVGLRVGSIIYEVVEVCDDFGEDPSCNKIVCGNNITNHL